jgi:hypothetical protein
MKERAMATQKKRQAKNVKLTIRMDDEMRSWLEESSLRIRETVATFVRKLINDRRDSERRSK